MLVSSVQIISRIDSQSKVIALFCGRHVGEPQRYTNMAAPYWALQICAKYFDEYLKLRKTHRIQTWRSDFFINLPFHSNFLNYFFIARQCKPRIGIMQLRVDFPTIRLD